MSLIATKLQPPPLRPGLVPRPALLERLRESASTRATLICAPAGAGKTSLLAAWAADPGERRPMAWLNLDEGDSEAAQFWTYAVEALRLMRPDLLDEAVPPAPVQADAVVSAVLPAVINAFASIEDQHVLVFDDLHLVEDAEVFEALEFLICSMPSSLHIALSARSNPPLPTARWRARRELTEIRAMDLYMDRDEAAALLGEAGVDLDDTTVTLLHSRTEGWPAGLYLAALSLREGSNAATDAGTFDGDDAHVQEYLLSEVLGRMTADDQAFLLRTSICGRLCADLCDAVLERDDSADRLAHLAHTNLFLTPLDRPHHWYRYHHLFAHLLRGRLATTEPDLVPVLHRRAAAWQLEHGDALEAVRHANWGGDHRGAGELLVDVVASLAAEGRLATFMRVLGELPRELVEADPRLLITAAWVELATGRYERLASVLDLLESAHDLARVEMPTTASVPASFDVLRAHSRFRCEGDLAEAIELARHAPAGEPDPTLAAYWFVRGGLAELLFLGGHPREIVEELTGDLASVPPGEEYLATRCVLAAWLAVAWCEIAERARDPERSSALAQASRLAGAARDGPNVAGPEGYVARLALARVALEDGDHEAAETELRAALDTPRYWQDPDLLARGLARLAEAVQRQGGSEEARRLLAEAHELVTEEPVAAGTRELVAAVARRLRLHTLWRARRHRVQVEQLTDRELQVLQLLSGELTQREIGRELFLGFNTVKGYSKSLYRKLGVSSRREAVEQGRRLQLI